MAPIDLWWCAFVAWAPLTLLAAQAARARQAGDRRAVLRAAGIALAIAFELGVPIKLIGVGESLDDLRPFDADSFARALLGLGAVD